MSSSTQRGVSVRDLVDEAKKRVVILVICVVGLSYLMSLTSSSVWVNLPAAASLIILLRYFSLDYEMRRKAVTYNSKLSSENTSSQKKRLEPTKIVQKLDWRLKVNSPVVEDAIDHFTRHIVSEWVTDLWYSRITPDREGPEELVQIMNGVLGELSSRIRNINIIDLLTRDLIHLICSHLELFRACQAKIEKQQAGPLSIEKREKELSLVLAAENKLHPALFSADAEHKVLQHLMDGLISFTFKPSDLQCAFFRYVTRELLACAVMRPVLNLASPRFINERIEIFVISKANKGVAAAQEVSQSKTNGSSKISSDHFSRFLDPNGTGVELMQLKSDQSRSGAVAPETDDVNGTLTSKDPLLSMDTRSSRSWSSLPLSSQSSNQGAIQRHYSGGEWGEMLDVMSRRKTAALAPENFENMWTKGRNYKKKEHESKVIKQASLGSSVSQSVAADNSKKVSKPIKDGVTKLDGPLAHSAQLVVTNQSMSNHSLSTLYQDDNDDDDDNTQMLVDEAESGSRSSFTSEEEDPNSVTGLDSPGTKVWDGKTNRNLAVAQIHHPLENPQGHIMKKTRRGHATYQRLPRSRSGRKRLRSSAQNLHVWQETERTSFFSGDGQDILSLKGQDKADDSSDASEAESLGRVYSGSTACSSALSLSIQENHSLSDNSLKNSLMVDTFFKLRCEVLGANIVKSGSRTFAVYSVSVTDVSNNSWSIKRRFRHFEELHRRLKEYREYNLHLPPKHFLSTGLDLPVIQERCILLDGYLKKLLQLPTISGSIEVWDFLSVDSQTYVFSNSFSIIETLSVDLNDKPSEMSRKVSDFTVPVINSSSSRREQLGIDQKESSLQMKHNAGVDELKPSSKGMPCTSVEKISKELGKSMGDSHSDNGTRKNASSGRTLEKTDKGRESNGLEHVTESLLDTASEPILPSEWVPPNLTVPILDLVDVIFQLQDGGWIRRKAFWVAKQLLHLGMGDALDDWLIEKVQLLRRGSVVASGIKRIEQILWPDGIFITKHPKRRPPSNISSSNSSTHVQQPTDMTSPMSSPYGRQQPEISSPTPADEQQQEAARRAKLVYELMIDNAPSAIVGLVGRKEYEQCAKDLYFFLQSSVCLKQLALDLLELLLLSAFPEMDDVFRQLHEEKHKFGEFQPN